MCRLESELARIRRQGFAVNQDRSERGVVAIGVAVREKSAVVAGLSISMPSARYVRAQLPRLVATLRTVAHNLESHLAAEI